ncbi:uncharacterized protein [Nicotiana sylvestris]|uniref:uncharacterized protein n=1 Tax=Nicotiana sylvestris TaxID=4096 RepID=UPI00388CCD47
MAVETEAMKYDSLFALMAQSDEDEENEDDEVNFRDVQRNLKSYSSKKLRSLANILIDAYYSLDNDKEIDGRVSACDTSKEIWEALQIAHEGTTQVKQSKIDMLTTEYELFRMKDDEFIQDMHTRFTSVINELHSIGDVIPRNKLVRKILSFLPRSWESNVNTITEAKDLQNLTMDELIGNLKIYEIKIKKYSERREPKKEKNLEQYKQSPDKAGKKNLVPEKRFNQKCAADNIVKQSLTAWGDSSSESEKELDVENSSMMAVETEATKYDSLFALMAQLDVDDEEDEDNEVNFRDVQRNLRSYSSKKLRYLSNVLIDAYYSLVNDKEILTVELGEAEQSRDDLVVCVVDLNETIANLELEKETLNENITSLSNEKHSLEEKIASTEEERDDLLVICDDLEETIEGLNREHRNVSLGKGKEVASESHVFLEKELTAVKNILCSELERNQQLQAELEKVRNDLEKSLKWTWSSDAVTAMYLNNSGNKNNGHFKENCQARVQSAQKNKAFTDRGAARGSRLRWTMDSGCLKHAAKKHHQMILTKSPTGKEYILEKKVKGTFSVSNQVSPKIKTRQEPPIGRKCFVPDNRKDQLGKHNANRRVKESFWEQPTKQGQKVSNKGSTR